MNAIIFIVVGVIVTMLFGKIRGYIVKNFTKKAINQFKIPGFNAEAEKKLKENGKKLNASVGNVLNKNGEEVFQWSKFLKAFKLNSGVLWVKDFLSMFNLRKLMFYVLILGVIFAYGYWKGRLNTPIKINLDYNKEFKMKLDSHYLFKPKFSQDLKIVDKKGNLVKQLKAKDFPTLAKKLKPLGFILEPIFIGGYEDKGGSIGGGLSFIKMWKWKLDVFLTSKLGAYLGTSYSITERSGIGVGVGKGLRKSDTRIMIYYKFRF